ncbi:MAG: hypothetical protein K0R66_163 [Gammaproteobacteria bacterium]|jgi:uncharacterized protein (UPF0276 family)|nr:hypothetical protein [Gammaproteobacteria bacterium]
MLNSLESTVGVGLRSQHYSYILEHSPKVSWFEILTDNYLDHSSPAFDKLLRIREQYPFIMHGVGLSIGGSDPLNLAYLKQMKALAQSLEPAFISDHFCWTSYQGRYSHELLPLPYTNEAIKHIVARVLEVQDFLKRPILLENISSYLHFECSEMSEAEFINNIARQSGCGILLDINNIYVNSQNHGFQALEYLQNISTEVVKQFHLAGYEKTEKFLIDNHGAPVYPEVWALYRSAVERFGAKPTCIEWDNHVPTWQVLMEENHKAQAILHSVQAKEVYETS